MIIDQPDHQDRANLLPKAKSCWSYIDNFRAIAIAQDSQNFT